VVQKLSSKLAQALARPWLKHRLLGVDRTRLADRPTAKSALAHTSATRA